MQPEREPVATPPSVRLAILDPRSAELATLLASLTRAQKHFDPLATDHGRSSVYEALLAVIDYVSGIIPQRPEVVLPLRELLYSLRSLDDGTVAPLLEPVKVDNRPPNPISQDLLRADAAVLMELKRQHKVGRAEAADTVARALNRLGYRDGGQKITGKQVALWRGQMRKVVKVPDPAAKRYRYVLGMLNADFPNDPKSAFEFYLGCVEKMHPSTISQKGGS